MPNTINLADARSGIRSPSWQYFIPVGLSGIHCFAHEYLAVACVSVSPDILAIPPAGSGRLYA